MRYLTAICLLLASSAAMAGDPGACYSIYDHDSRNYCLARARGDATMCYTIHDSAKRSECLAEVRK